MLHAQLKFLPDNLIDFSKKAEPFTFSKGLSFTLFLAQQQLRQLFEWEENTSWKFRGNFLNEKAFRNVPLKVKFGRSTPLISEDGHSCNAIVFSTPV